jgi:hypothetical protein
MFKRLAKFWPLEPRRIPPRLREIAAANDNLPGFRRPRGERRSPPSVLVCRWSAINGGTQLGCRWQLEALAPAALEDPDLGRINNQAQVACDPTWPSSQYTKLAPAV